MEVQNDQRVVAIRADSKVGFGSCTSIDECMTDGELIEALNQSKVVSPADAVKWAHKIEGLHIENALNYRQGEDSDPELANYRQWKES